MTARHGQGFPRAARIRRRREFLSLGRGGEKRRTASFVLISQANAETRLGITVSRKVGGAVIRNLLKRRVREVFRRHPDRQRFMGDLLVIAKAGVGAVSMSAVQREMSTILKLPGSLPRSDRQC